MWILLAALGVNFVVVHDAYAWAHHDDTAWK